VNLHEWITARVDEVGAVAEQATPGSWEAVVDNHGRGQVDASVWADMISYYVTEKVSSGERHIADAKHIALHGPAAVLRRCEADRRILARHKMPIEGATWSDATMCIGCDTTGEFDYPVTENINDCPELLDLAHAHGITPDELAALDRPERPPQPAYRRPTVTAAITTDQIPEALRGPRWGHR
jgi:hypothetical protein